MEIWGSGGSRRVRVTLPSGRISLLQLHKPEERWTTFSPIPTSLEDAIEEKPSLSENNLHISPKKTSTFPKRPGFLSSTELSALPFPTL